MKNSVRVIRETVSLSLKFARGSYFLFILATLLQAALAGPQLAFFSQRVIDLSVAAAKGEFSFTSYLPSTIFFALCLLLPSVLDTVRENVIAPRYLTDVKSGVNRLINEKCLRMKYAYFEDSKSVDTITLVGEKSSRGIAPLYCNRMENMPGYTKARPSGM